MKTKKEIGTAQTPSGAVQDNGRTMNASEKINFFRMLRNEQVWGNASHTSHDCPICGTHADAVRWISGMGSERLCPKCGWRGFTWQNI